MISDFNGKLIVVTAPSGAGKTTIVRYLLKHYKNLDFSVSATTREKRDHEVDGQDYFFISPEQFKSLIDLEAFAEFEMVYENQYYGTLKSEIDRIWNENKHIIFDIDVQGALSLKKQYGDQCLTIFVKPPSEEILFERLKNRNTDSPEAIARRIKKASIELKFENLFDYVLVNNLLDVACKEAEIVINNFIAT